MPLRFRKQRKAVVNSNDKKMPNGILEEQGIAHWVLVQGTGVGLSLNLASLSLSTPPGLMPPLASNTKFLYFGT